MPNKIIWFLSLRCSFLLLPYLSIIPYCDAIYTPNPDDAKRLTPPVSLTLCSCNDTRNDCSSRHRENAPDHHESHKCRHDENQRCVVVLLHYSITPDYVVALLLDLTCLLYHILTRLTPSKHTPLNQLDDNTKDDHSHRNDQQRHDDARSWPAKLWHAHPFRTLLRGLTWLLYHVLT